MASLENLTKQIIKLQSKPGHETVKCLLRDVLKEQLGATDDEIALEDNLKIVCKGRIDTLWGRTIFEIKSDLGEHKYFEKVSFMEKSSFKIKPKNFIEILRLLEKNMKEEDNPSSPLQISIDLEEEKQPNDWLQNLKIISQNFDAKLVLALEKEMGKDKKEEQLPAKMKKYKKRIWHTFLHTAFNIIMYKRVFGLSNLFKKILQKFSLKRAIIITWLLHKQRKLYLNSINRKKILIN